ncbi:hypothetical protein IQ264_27475 [Phormidium sp. LEGE 05292]|uniref:hypothetical protein n=1 Tax=[Phormidium] sp. LEGE 05292 TaxID=767427 RepID=UPI00187F0B1A|nr:hypothetical protein [Phormidium sp. LEGE 05292]MBE9229148.1 hypothetical protein [Phormidium sp. LEGE 05292]
MSTSNTILDFITIKKIAELLLTLPSEQLLLSAETMEQVEHWIRYRDNSCAIASTLVARFLSQDYLLIRLKKAGRISRRGIEGIWSKTLFVEQLWGLIQATAPFVEDDFRKQKIDYPFNSAFELFQDILSCEVNANFSLCFSPYQEFSADKYEKNLRNAGKLVTGENFKYPVQKKLDQFTSQLPESPLMTFVLAVAHQKSSRNGYVKAALEDFYTHCKRMWDAEATMWHNRKSYRWNKGHKQYGKVGGYSNDP